MIEVFLEMSGIQEDLKKKSGKYSDNEYIEIEFYYCIKINLGNLESLKI